MDTYIYIYIYFIIKSYNYYTIYLILTTFLLLIYI